MISARDVEAVVAEAKHLSLAPRSDRWCHLSLCVLDAVFSINANYSTTSRTVRTYGANARLEPLLAPAVEVAAGVHFEKEQSLATFLATDGSLDPELFAASLENRQLTSTRSGIRKSDAAQRYARILVEHKITVLSDVSALLMDNDRTQAVSRALATVPGHGRGVRVSYLWMLAGDDSHVKSDRMVLRWMGRVLRRAVDVREAEELIVSAAESLEVTPWVLDHAVWNAERA